MDQFPVRSRCGNRYIMLAYHIDTKAIHVSAFQYRNDCHRLENYNAIMNRLKAKGHSVDLQVLDNKASFEYRRTIVDEWNCTFQLVPTDVHRRNIAERAIRTYKAHFLAIIAGIANYFPNFLWDHLLPQTELTLNLLRQSTLAPDMSAWEQFNGLFNFDATPIVPIGRPVIIHNKPGTHLSWDFRGRQCFNIGPALNHYRCFRVVDAVTKHLIYSDTVAFLHDYLTQPTVSPSDRIVHALNFLSCAISDAPEAIHHEQLSVISKLRDIFSNWKISTTMTPPTPNGSPPPY